MKSMLMTAAVLILFAAGCTSVRLGLDYDESFDFSRFKTFAFVTAAQEKPGESADENPLMDSRIRNAIDETLSARGYVKAASGEADFLVGYYLSIERKQDVNTVSAGFGYGSYGSWGSVGIRTSVSTYEEGTIIIDIADGKTDRLVWRGSGSRRVEPTRNPGKTTERVNRAVSEILEQFPPKR